MAQFTSKRNRSRHLPAQLERPHNVSEHRQAPDLIEPDNSFFVCKYHDLQPAGDMDSMPGTDGAVSGTTALDMRTAVCVTLQQITYDAAVISDCYTSFCAWWSLLARRSDLPLFRYTAVQSTTMLNKRRQVIRHMQGCIDWPDLSKGLSLNHY